MRGGVGWLVCGVVGFAGWLGVGLPAVAQNAAAPSQGQAIFDGLARDAAEARRREEEARRQADREDAILACRARVTAREAEFSSRADFLRARIACADDPQRFR